MASAKFVRALSVCGALNVARPCGCETQQQLESIFSTAGPAQTFTKHCVTSDQCVLVLSHSLAFPPAGGHKQVFGNFGGEILTTASPLCRKACAARATRLAASANRSTCFIMLRLCSQTRPQPLNLHLAVQRLLLSRTPCLCCCEVQPAARAFATRSQQLSM